MAPERWQQIDRLFHAALQLPTEERAAFLDQACAGDQALRREIESLLAVQTQTRDFFDTPAFDLAAAWFTEQQASPITGQRLSHYQILSVLGKGGMGTVYLAFDERLERQVALKLLPADFRLDAERVRRFEREAKTASALNHPNIITIYEIGEAATEAGQTPFIATEFITGHTLREYITTAGVSLPAAHDIAMQIASALSAAHAAGIIHRDIKPENIMVRPDGLVKVLDFGLAKLTERLPSASDPEAPPSLAVNTNPGVVMGTLAYMSPEQASGQRVSPPSDIFALGIVLYELVTGQHPFRADALAGYLYTITWRTPPPPSQLKPEIPAAFDALILRMLEKDARQRPTAGEVAQALQEMERRGDTVALPVTHAGVTRADEGFWVAVLPFKWRGAHAGLETLAEGLSEEIVTGLSRFSYLRVIARSSTLRYASDSGDVRAIGKELGARYVMEGTLRQAGSGLRVAVQLVDASTGAHLWAETYNRTFSPEAVFELQDDLVPRIVSTVADWYGVLPHSMSEAVRLKPPDQLSPYEAVLRSFGYYERLTAEEHAAVRAGLERAVHQAPGNADGWAMLAMLYGEEYRFSFNAQPDPLERSLQAARRAVDAGTTNHFAWLALAQALFFRKEFDPFRDAAERAIALNSMDGSTLEYLGHLIAFSGDWGRGCEVSERARQLNPNHPWWYWAVHFLDAYRKGDYQTARTFMLKSNPPGLLLTQALLAALYGQLGEREAAEKTLRSVLNLKPDFALTARGEFGKWYLPELVEHLIDGLRKAGLGIADVDAEGRAAPLSVTDMPDALNIPGSGDRPAIAVLPFANLSADGDQEYFSDGLAEEIINRLAQVPGLKVIARTSAFAFRGKEQDIREIAGALGVSTILQGSVRRAGSRLRVTAQLIDAVEGGLLWAERFDREMTEVFAVQDEVAAAIAGALQVTLTAQPSPARPYEPNLSAYEAFLKGKHHYYKFSPESFTRAEQEFTRAIALDPQWAEPHAALGEMYFTLGFYGWRPLDDMVQMARAEARMAVDILPSHPMAHAVLALMAALRDHDWKEAEARFGAATASGSLDPNGRMLCAMYLLAAGRLDEAASEMALAIKQDPLNAFWRARQAWILICGERYDEAIAEGRKALEFDDTNHQARLMVALSLTFQGKMSEARKEAEEVFRVAPWYPLGTGLQAGLLAKAGERDRAARLLPAITRTEAAPIGMMMYHLVCAEIDAAIDWYQKDIELGRPNAPMMAFAGFLRPLRAHPRWPRIAKMMNLPD